MRSMFSTLELAKRALQAQRAALDITAHNIANAHTPGYSRQAARLVTTNPYSVPQMNSSVTAGLVGTGVRLAAINRIRDQFMDYQYRGEASLNGEYQEISQQLMRIETVFNEPSENGLRQVMDNFFAAWQELSKDPSSLTTRSLVYEQSQALAETFTHINALLAQSRDNIEQAMQMRVQELNSIARQIADLNQQIGVAQLSGHQPNDLLDRRDVLLDQLSELGEIDIEVTLDSNDVEHVKVYLKSKDNSSRWLLINDSEAIEMKLEVSAHEYYYVDDSGTNVTFDNIGGRLGGLQTALDKVDDYQGHLDALAQELTTQVNNLHDSGYYEYPEGNMAQPTEPFFEYPAGSYMRVNGFYEDEVGLKHIATSTSSTVLNGDNARIIAQLRDQAIAGLGNTTFHDYYNSFISALGVESQEYQRLVENQDLLVSQIEQSRQSVSGVSIDEEMANMIKFQNAYNAAARMVTAFDEMIDMVVNRMGLVGR